jgi:pimeloyl-ACP methyl ester carboxylesterase
MIERPLIIRSRGEELVGVLTLPDAPATSPEVGIVFAQSGSRGRIGNTFHYPYFSRRFAAAGIPTLRFDPAGLGDSTGVIPPQDMRAVYQQIQSGLFTGNTLDAIDELLRHVQPRRLLVFGVCGGAASAVLAAPRSARVDGAILLSVPVLLDSPAVSRVTALSKDYAREYLVKNYAKKLLSPSAWLRLLTAQSDVRKILQHAAAALKPDARRRRASGTAATRHPNPRFNEQVRAAIDALVARGNRLLLVFGQNDGFRNDWEHEFHKVYWDGHPEYARHIEAHTIPGCNHMFTLREWQDQVVELSLAWLGSAERRAPAAGAIGTVSS